jgi:hypothetical protein
MERRRSIDYRGVGQSGYTVGRHEHDLALERELMPRNIIYRRDVPEETLQDELGTDDRFTGRGGALPDDESP